MRAKVALRILALRHFRAETHLRVADYCPRRSCCSRRQVVLEFHAGAANFTAPAPASIGAPNADHLAMTSTERPRALVVDDEPSICFVAQRHLASLGYAADTADSVEAALRLAADRRYDAAIVDVMLGSGNGVELAAELRRSHPGLRLVFISALELHRVAAMPSEGARPFSYLHKPFELDALTRALAGEG